jgi:hypothetical protein
VDIANMPLRTRSLESYARFPLTVELWCKLPSEKKQRFHLLAANAPGWAAAHWEIYSTPLQGHLTAKLSAVESTLRPQRHEPVQLESFVRITDDAWHYVALTCDGRSASLFVDGKLAARQDVKPASSVASKEDGRSKAPTADDLELFVGSDVPQNTEAPLPALVDDLRISSIARPIETAPTAPLTADEHTVALWHFDEETGNRRRDASKADNALAYSPGISSAWTPRSSTRGDAEAWEKETDDDWLDGRVNQMDKGPFWGCSMRVPPSLGNKEGPYAARGLVLRLGDKGEAAVLFDRARMQLCAAWLGGIEIPARRYGLIEHPKPVGKIVFSTPSRPVCDDPRYHDGVKSRWAPLPKGWAHYDGIFRCGARSVLSYRVDWTNVLEMPWIAQSAGQTAITRTLEIARRPYRADKVEIHVMSSPLAKRRQVAGIDLVLCEEKGEVFAAALAPADAPVKQSEVKFVFKADDVFVGIEKSEGDVRFQVMLWRGPAKELERFVELARKAGPAEDLAALTSREKKEPAAKAPSSDKPIITVGQLASSKNGGFAVDTLTLPYENPHRSIHYLTGLGFLGDGRIAVSTIYGDVWIVSGVDEKLGRLTWNRFASGMYQPLGLAIQHEDARYRDFGLFGVRGKTPRICILERGQITELEDRDGDGQADFYRNYYNGWDETGAGHAYDTALKLGPDGSFYFFKGQCSERDCRESGSLVRVLPNGWQHETFATGFRHPIGLGIDPVLGTLTGGDQQGNWMPATRIDQYRRGGFYGDMRTHHRDKPPTDYDKPICWLPQYVDNSAGGQIWVPRGTWGPLAGGLLHLSWGRCTVHWLMREAIDGHGPDAVLQGGVVRLPIPKLLSGPITGAFNPQDGHLYVVGLHGWQTSGEKDGCLQRIRYTGAKLNMPLELNARKDGLLVRFSDPLDAAAAEDVKNYSIEQWNYRYSEQYGSDHWSVADPGRMGHDAVKIASAAASADGRSVLLKIPGIKPVMQMKLAYRLKARDGTPVEDVIHHTIHKLGAAE